MQMPDNIKEMQRSISSAILLAHPDKTIEETANIQWDFLTKAKIKDIIRLCDIIAQTQQGRTQHVLRVFFDSVRERN